MEYRWESFTHPGGRRVNEDSLLVTEHCWAVADGLGGHARGEVASRMAVDILEVALLFGEEMEVVFDRIGRRLNRMRGPFTTLVTAQDTPEGIVFTHVGDSRGYYFRGGALLFRTLDDSLPQRLVAQGEITPEDIRSHPQRNRLTAALGGGMYPLPHSAPPIPPQPGDALLLVSDGFWQPVTEEAMLSALRTAATPGAWLEAMLADIVPEEQADNMTAVAVYIL